jgi:hypothetical protein
MPVGKSGGAVAQATFLDRRNLGPVFLARGVFVLTVILRRPLTKGCRSSKVVRSALLDDAFAMMAPYYSAWILSSGR